MGSKLVAISSTGYGRRHDGPLVTIAHYCPACDELHHFACGEPFPQNLAKWTFDGNNDRPTFQPSMHIKVGPFPSGEIEVCHYFLHAGRIQYLTDCTHDKAGTTIELPDVPADKLQWMTEGRVNV